MNLSPEASKLFAPPSVALNHRPIEIPVEEDKHKEPPKNDLFDFTDLPFFRVTILPNGETVPYNPFKTPSLPVNLSWQDTPKPSTLPKLEPETPITTQTVTFNTPSIGYTEPTPPEYQPKVDFYSVFRQYVKTTYNTDSNQSFSILDSFSTEKINQLGELLINCHIFELLTQTQEAYPEAKIISVKSKSRDKKTDRIGFSINTENDWIKITSDGEKIFITKNNNYHRALDPTLSGIETTQEKLKKILSNDAKRLFAGEQPTPIRRTYLQPKPRIFSSENSLPLAI